MARAEMRSALEVLTSTIASVRVVPDVPLSYLGNYVRRGLASLIVDVTYR